MRDEKAKNYLEQIDKQNSESARSHLFAALLQELLGQEIGFIDRYVSGIEQSIKNKNTDRVLKGRVDNLFGNLIIEFERSIPKKLDEATEQLRRYTAILWSQEEPDKRSPYICMATDGLRFRTYTPILKDPKAKELKPENVQLKTIEETDWSKLEPMEVYYWLDRYFLRKKLIKPTTETISRDFGAKSHAFQTIEKSLLSCWQELKNQDPYTVIYENWDKYLRIVYGSEVGGDELFIRHTYLTTLVKVMAWIRIYEITSSPDDKQIIKMLDGTLFKEYGIENFLEEDFFSWLSREKSGKIGIKITRELYNLLQY
ncbi:hypothetical protein KKB18_10845, partial [bacterium]|nr:hypothetical protein [bacterium]